MSAGTISAMISSLKSNNSLRRNKRLYSKFYKKPVVEYTVAQPITREENLQIVAENKRLLNQKTFKNRIYALFLIALYGGIIFIVLKIYFTSGN